MQQAMAPTHFACGVMAAGSYPEQRRVLCGRGRTDTSSLQT